MRFKAQLDGLSHEISATADGSVAVGAESYQARVTRPSEDRRLVQLGDKTYEIRIVEGGSDAGEYVLELNGERIRVSVTDVVRGGPSAAAAPPPASGVHAGEADSPPAHHVEAAGAGIVAPMPGKVVNVLVKPGDRVEAGDVVLILEAMKMENELCAISQGTVKDVLVKKGDQAERGQLLVSLE